jgi:hypothetical protein
MVVAMLEVFFSRRQGRFNGNKVRKRLKRGHFSGPIETFQCIKSNRGFRRQDLKGIHLPSFRFSWKLKKLCRFDFFVFESWQSAEYVMGLTCDFTVVCHDSKNKKIEPNMFL